MILGKEGVPFLTWTAFKAFLIAETPLKISEEEGEILIVEGIKNGIRFVYYTTDATEKADFAATFGETTYNVG